MTRFLSRRLQECLPGLNDETDALFSYHQATKHTYDSVRTGARYLDWANQPDPFRTYAGAPLITLAPQPPFPDVGAFAAMQALGIGEESLHEHASAQREQPELNGAWLSSLLWHSMAISAWKRVPRTGNSYSLRVNPSSGNLHPTETHVALRGFTNLEDGLYHYRADCQGLELRSRGGWTYRLAEALETTWALDSPLIIGLTSIFWREAWKYGDRAYRYCCHDLGHAMMSLLLAARALGYRGGAITNFPDLHVTKLLGLSGGDEAPMAFLVFPSSGHHGRPPAVSVETFAGVPNALSAEEVPHDLLLDMHCATLLDHPAADSAITESEREATHASTPVPALTAPHRLAEPARDNPLRNVVRRRRSALDFDAGSAPMERSELDQILDFATRDWAADWRGNFPHFSHETQTGRDFITLYLYLHRVRDCEPGIYRWHRPSATLEQLHRANVQRVAAYLSLEQTLAGNCCVAFSMIADLARAARLFGNRAYRYVHFEAGAIGQRLYIGAEALNWNATGIGAFYDDDVHRYLGFLEETEHSVSSSMDTAERSAFVMLGSPASREAAAQTPGAPKPSADMNVPADSPEALPTESNRLPHQVIYHFAIGRAVADPRLDA